MDIWEKLVEKAKKEYYPTAVSPFIDAHHVVCAIEAENGEIPIPRTVQLIVMT